MRGVIHEQTSQSRNNARRCRWPCRRDHANSRVSNLRTGLPLQRVFGETQDEKGQEKLCRCAWLRRCTWLRCGALCREVRALCGQTGGLCAGRMCPQGLRAKRLIKVLSGRNSGWNGGAAFLLLRRFGFDMDTG